MTVIVDYGAGNLFSLKSSLHMIGAEAVVSSDPSDILAADRVILPGVGAFGDAAELLRRGGLDRAVTEKALSGGYILGICLGMQLLFDRSFEDGVHNGLGLIPGDVVPIKPRLPSGYKVPHIGWNSLEFPSTRSPLFASMNSGEYVYFVHSFFADCDSAFISARTDYGIPLTAAVERGNVLGCQFHPEKSGKAGLRILKAFCDMRS